MPSVQKVFTESEVAKHTQPNDAWFILDGEVYDVSQFLEDHPGGSEILLGNAGKNVSNHIDALHRHSQFARMQLAEYRIGVVQDYVGPTERVVDGAITKAKKSADMTKVLMEMKDDTFLDLNKPLMPQVWDNRWSKRYYLEQVHIPRHTVNSPRFFSSSFLEMFTKNTWYGVLLLWVHIIYGCVYYAAQNMSAGLVLQLYLDGLFLWTVYEYVFHRHVFHMEDRLPDHRYAFVLHFLMHGVHHFLPMDRLRLVMPPLLLVVLSLPVVVIIRQFASWPATAALLGGSYTGYLIYDMMHYYFHHGQVVAGYLQRMKTNHMDHHYVDPNKGFGVSNLTWDAAFDTLLPINKVN